MTEAIDRHMEGMREFNEIDFSEPEPDNLSAMGEKLFLLKQSEKDAKENFEEIKDLRMLAEEVLCAQMEAVGIESFKTSRGTFYTRSDFYASIPPDNRPVIFEWLRDNDLGSLIKETVNSRTLSATIKEMMAEGETVPAEINVTTKKKIGMRKK